MMTGTAASVSDAHVAAILGHRDTDMIYRHYSHLGSQIKHLRGIVTDNIVPTSQKLQAGRSEDC